MYHVIHDDHLEIKLVLLYCIVVLYKLVAMAFGASYFSVGLPVKARATEETKQKAEHHRRRLTMQGHWGVVLPGPGWGREGHITKATLHVLWSIGVRDGGQGGSCPPPPIRAVCGHEFGQRVDIIRAKHNTCLNYTNLGYVTAVNGKNSATPQNMDPGKFPLLPPPLNPFGQNSVCPPKWMLARTPMLWSSRVSGRQQWERPDDQATHRL